MSAERHLPGASVVPENIYPLYPLDSDKTNRCFVSWLMRFNDVLDPEQLNNALVRLLEIGDWKKLGGRLRLKVRENGDLEVHVPNISGEDSRKTFFTHQTFDVEIQNHPVACQFPTPTAGPSIQPISEDFKPFVTRQSFTTFQQLVQEKLPLISLHISSFRDATLVSLVWPHVLMDAFGGQALLAAWSSVLATREEDIPTISGARNDPLREAVSSNPEKWEELKLEKRRLKGMDLFKFLSRYLWNNIRDAPRERRVIYLPKIFLDRMKNLAQKQIHETHSCRDSGVFFSSGDALVAWVTRAMALSESTPRPITILSLLNSRFRLPEFINSAGVFLQNLTLGTYTFLSSQEARGPIGPIALSHRQHFNEQSTEKQVRAFMRTGYQDIDAGKTPGVLFGEANALPIILNNMVKADLIKTVDFRAAVVRQGDTSKNRANPLGTMLMYYYENVGEPYKGFNLFTMLGQDYAGNHWLMGTLLPRAWDKIMEELGNL
ncbi:hypothetical protein N7481_005696 [Penicillium waksmanii]|uniref:uncharacterized protein n=1 Tax=Penicillium waksmanii TaxID=69791 RepID=UPI0025476BAE|nr:uncharacterized protein N7481_005696 [Penicillium waksmanii]KAJ5983597.1 hypothetical protein N7481_005696 [Penicillium waksmanii]